MNIQGDILLFPANAKKKQDAQDAPFLVPLTFLVRRHVSHS